MARYPLKYKQIYSYDNMKYDDSSGKMKRSFPHSWLITGCAARLTRWVSLMDQELLTLPEHLSSTPIISGDPATRSLVLCVCFADHCLVSFFLFLFDIVLSVLRVMASDYPFSIFKLFFVLVMNIAGMKCCSLEFKQQSITISLLLSSVEHPFHI